jgi:hypothetical protein
MPFGFNDNNDTKIDPQWAVDVLHKSVFFLNGASDDMNVNGSVTPVSFSFTPSSGEIWYVDKVSIFLSDNDLNENDKFGKITALTNGLQLQIQSKGISLEIANIKDNIDMNLIFENNGVSSPSNVFAGIIRFNPQIILLASNSDFIRFRVRDNLTSVNFLRASVSIWKTNP